MSASTSGAHAGGGLVRRFGARQFDFNRQVAVMAIVNRTPDSFYDGGRTYALDAAVEACARALEEGADWLDIGGVPFSPLTPDVDVAEELRRVLPAVERARALTDAVISVDTFRADVAREALATGADVINDTSGLHDPVLAEVVARAGAGLVVTHSKAAPRATLRRPDYADVVAEVRDFLARRVDVALQRGLRPEQVIIDPGHDLNKNTYHSLELTRRLREVADLGYPLLAAVSNKDFLSETLGVTKAEVREATIAALVVCVLQGARILRVHDVAPAVRAVRVTEAILGWRAPAAPRHNLD